MLWDVLSTALDKISKRYGLSSQLTWPSNCLFLQYPLDKEVLLSALTHVRHTDFVDETNITYEIRVR